MSNIHAALDRLRIAATHPGPKGIWAQGDTRFTYRDLQQDVKLVAAELDRLRMAQDPAICRQQFPDGSVPENILDCATGWKRAYDKLLIDRNRWKERYAQAMEQHGFTREFIE